VEVRLKKDVVGGKVDPRRALSVQCKGGWAGINAFRWALFFFFGCGADEDPHDQTNRGKSIGRDEMPRCLAVVRGGAIGCFFRAGRRGLEHGNQG
jgi:hypothetical protein